MWPAVDSASGLGAARGMAFLAMADLGRIRRRTLPDGQVRFYLDFRPHGRVFSIPTDFGPMPIADEGTARRLLEGIRARVADGVPIDGALAAFQRTAASHVLQRVQPWLEMKQREADAGSLSPGSVRGMRSDVARHWPFWAGVSVHEVKRAQLDDWRMQLLEKLGPATTRNVLSYFRSFLRWLEDRGEIRGVARFPTVSVPQREGLLLTFSQQEAVLAEIPEERRGIYLALVDLALRPNEARAVLAVDFEREEAGGEVPGWLVVQRAAKGYGARAPVRGTKTGAAKRVPVTDRLAAWIAAWVPRDARLQQAPLFAFGGRMWTHSTLQRTWQVACAAACVPAVGLRRGTRHSTATGLRRAGVPIGDIQRFLGHSDVANTERYSRWSDAALVPIVKARFER